MPKFDNDGRVTYYEGEEVLTAEQLLARGRIIVNPGVGLERKAKASDMSPPKPTRRTFDPESNEIVQKLAMDYPLNKFPEARQSMTFLTSVR